MLFRTKSALSLLALGAAAATGYCAACKATTKAVINNKNDDQIVS